MKIKLMKRVLKNNKDAEIALKGVFVALALIVIGGLATGVTFNKIIEGMGDLLLGFAGIAFIVIIAIAVLTFIFK